ncbi:ATP-dependent nuclease [Agrobacterium sp. rho-13.3]|uniref:ATP-dependent nuclease n=1 Tax=Agrobacterium sp. rho-13.3 TaxID=3072980 RepID=UPI002A0DA4CE|nr:AAA family ATPase [Agrobacterium sp. rho-13.3]MDX8312059.1 AAA family ATPase [Agrobacterium sp. rho-13.3]
MLKKIELFNFRKHASFSVSCKERNVLIGPNNAGKSSLLDALRIFSDVQRYASRRVPILKSYDDFGVCALYEATNSIFSVTLENICRNYSDDYAIVIITNEIGNKLHIRINPEKQPEIFIQTEDKIEKTKKFFEKSFPEKVVVVPTLGQFEESEKLNDADYVRSIEFTRLASRNFRNIWRNKPKEHFEEFRDLIVKNWPDVDISATELNSTFPPTLQMFYTESGKSREVYWSGFGFQAWLQMMTHFLRGSEDDVLVLDEPDVYLHADLQRRLFHIAKKRFRQLFLATHSSEIMNEANATDVILIKPGLLTGARITSDAGYRSAHALLGSSENADFARLTRAKRIIAFEGNDRNIYKKIERKIIRSGVLNDPDTISLKIGGYEHWQRVDNLTWMFKELFGIDAKIVALFDRDYRCDAQIEDFEGVLSTSGVWCRVLRRKEIENYLLELDPLADAFIKSALRRNIVISKKEFEAVLSDITDRVKDDCLINVQSEFTKYSNLKRDKRDTSTILKIAKEEFDREWKEIGPKKRIGGKQVIIDLNNYFQKQYGFSVSNSTILEEFRKDSIDGELVKIIEEINVVLS